MMNTEQQHKHNQRVRDRRWFKKHTSVEYMSTLTIHHEWDNGRYTFLVTVEEHVLITKKELNND